MTKDDDKTGATEAAPVVTDDNIAPETPEGETEAETEDVKPDAEAYAAKITELTAEIEGLNGRIADLNTQLTASKAANYDLMTSMPGAIPEASTVEGDTGNGADFDDLFESKKED